MNYRKFTAFVLAAVACAACSEPERENGPAPATGSTRVVLQQEATRPVDVYAFRLQDGTFRFDTLFREGWTPQGTLSVRMPNGRYRFLFAAGGGANLSLAPTPVEGQTSWDDVAFTLRESAVTSGTYLPADDLFLQYPAANAAKEYTLAGTELTVPAALTRAVSRIRIFVKRGYRNGEDYVEVPYAAPHSALEQIDRIELTAANAGLRVRPDGSYGTASVDAALDAAEYAELTPDGFVRLDGPLVIPPADGADVALELTVVPAAGVSLQKKQLKLTGKAERNMNLDVTLWLTSDYPTIGVEIRTAPIEAAQDGDSGIWE